VTYVTQSISPPKSIANSTTISIPGIHPHHFHLCCVYPSSHLTSTASTGNKTSRRSGLWWWHSCRKLTPVLPQRKKPKCFLLPLRIHCWGWGLVEWDLTQHEVNLLCHISSPLFSGHFGDGVSQPICPGWPPNPDIKP
jgi:hypothetical protein